MRGGKERESEKEREKEREKESMYIIMIEMGLYLISKNSESM